MVLSAIRKVMPLAPDDPVVLVGAGGLGLSTIVMLRALGHQSIISVNISADKRAAAVKAGAMVAINGAGNGPAKEVEAAAGGPVQAVVDFVNSSTTAQLALEVLAKGGKMVQVGVMGGELKLSLVGLIFKAVTIMAYYTGTPAQPHEVAGFAQDGKLAPIPITTLPWDGANTALMRLRDGQVTGRLVLTQP